MLQFFGLPVAPAALQQMMVVVPPGLTAGATFQEQHKIAAELVEDRQQAVVMNLTLPTKEANYLKNKGTPHITRFRAYRTAAFKYVLAQCKLSSARCAQRDIYQFGVYTGISMKQLLWASDSRSVEPKYWARLGKGASWMHKMLPGARDFPRRLYGFDSFQGLPSEQNRGVLPRYVQKSGFEQGAWDARKAMGVTRSDELMERVSDYLNDTRVKLVPGFFNVSLTSQVAQEMKPALYIDIDVDLYSSTMTALSWMFERGLVEPGTVIGYDDWGQGGKHDGERKAHAEIAKNYGVHFETLNAQWGGAAFRVESIAASKQPPPPPPQKKKKKMQNLNAS